MTIIVLNTYSPAKEKPRRHQKKARTESGLNMETEDATRLRYLHHLSLCRGGCGTTAIKINYTGVTFSARGPFGPLPSV
jgi:hypothetical protein